MLDKICKVCESSFRVAPSREQTAHFCSRKCYEIHREQHPEQYPLPPLRGRSIKVECEQCGKTFRTKMAHHLNGRGRFCSVKCYGKYVRSHPELYGGSNHWNWKGGRTTVIRLLRQSEEYKEWRDAVFRRDNWTCQNPECGYKGHKIVAHHIKDFNEYPELRYDVDNGQTLCRACHLKLHYNIGEGRQFKAGQCPWNKLPIPTREKLEQLYWGWGLSTVDIARTFGTSHKTVRKWLRHYNILIRSLSEAQKNLFNNQREAKDESRVLEKMQAVTWQIQGV